MGVKRNLSDATGIERLQARSEHRQRLARSKDKSLTEEERQKARDELEVNRKKPPPKKKTPPSPKLEPWERVFLAIMCLILITPIFYTPQWVEDLARSMDAALYEMHYGPLKDATEEIAQQGHLEQPPEESLKKYPEKGIYASYSSQHSTDTQLSTARPAVIDPDQS